MKYGIKNKACNINKMYRKSSLDTLNSIFPSEFITGADSYLHYSNQILFEINRSETAALLVILILYNNDPAGCIMAFVLNEITKKDKPRIHYAEYKVFTKSFDGVIDRYCGVPP